MIRSCAFQQGIKVEIIKGYCEVGLNCPMLSCSRRWTHQEEEKVGEIFKTMAKSFSQDADR